MVAAPKRAETDEAMKFATASATSKHGRPNNQDYAGYILLDGLACWVVADGLGGHNGGEVASRLAVEQIIASCEAHPQFSREALMGHLQAAQKAILDQQAAQSELASMRTTVVLMTANHQAALCAHLGDSRLYHFRQGKIIFQTRDHSVPQALVNAGELAREGIRFHEDRNRLLRALGEDSELRPAISEPRNILPGDAFLLCTDGFWEYVLEEEMQSALAGAVTSKDWLKLMEERLRQEAGLRQHKQPDNYTAIGIFLTRS
jgi:serine/threonine protein phosphatase PrpC